MGAHTKAYERLRRVLTRICTDRRTRVPGTYEYTVLTDAMNTYLEEWYSCSHMATEWDAGQWGFDVDRWMIGERKRMSAHPMTKARDGRWYTVRNENSRA